MPNSWMFLLVLLILSRIFEPPFPFDLVIFLNFYFLKDVGDFRCFSFYHRGKFALLVVGISSSKKGWNNKYFFVSDNCVQGSFNQLEYAWSKLGRNLLTEYIPCF